MSKTEQFWRLLMSMSNALNKMHTLDKQCTQITDAFYRFERYIFALCICMTFLCCCSSVIFINYTPCNSPVCSLDSVLKYKTDKNAHYIVHTLDVCCYIILINSVDTVYWVWMACGKQKKHHCSNMQIIPHWKWPLKWLWREWESKYEKE